VSEDEEEAAEGEAEAEVAPAGSKRIKGPDNPTGQAFMYVSFKCELRGGVRSGLVMSGVRSGAVMSSDVRSEV
jgi:hypothetical protein